jgi:hypothetical protein
MLFFRMSVTDCSARRAVVVVVVVRGAGWHWQLTMTTQAFVQHNDEGLGMKVDAEQSKDLKHCLKTYHSFSPYAIKL